MYILLTGNPVDGTDHHGPFSTAEDAGDWAVENKHDQWWVVELTPVRKPSEHRDNSAKTMTTIPEPLKSKDAALRELGARLFDVCVDYAHILTNHEIGNELESLAALHFPSETDDDDDS